jgi:hypothetical protein
VFQPSSSFLILLNILSLRSTKKNGTKIIILEKWFDPHWTETNEQPTNTHSINTMYFKNEVKIIITVTKLETNDIEKMSLTGVLCEDNLTNLDKGSAFPDEFIIRILQGCEHICILSIQYC